MEDPSCTHAHIYQPMSICWCGINFWGPNLWHSPRGKRVVTHWASMLRWIWSISECNLMTRDSWKRTPMGGLFMRERRGSGPEKQPPKHNPCIPVGRNWIGPIWTCDPGHFRERGKNQAPAYSVSDKGLRDRLKPEWFFNSIHDIC